MAWPRLRIGYVMAHPQVIRAVDQVLVPFAVNGLAQAAALASLRHDGELRERVAVTLAERTRVQAALRHLGFSTPDAQANFLWLPAGEAAATLTLKLETLGVVTRPFPDEGVRVTIGTPSENDHFLDAFEAAVEPLELAAHWRLPTGRLAGAVQGWVDRIDAADTRLLAHAGVTHHGLTDPDPGGTEQWDSAQVWAHLAEIGAYWLGELEHVVDAASSEPVAFGRVKTNPERIAAIEQGRHRDVVNNLTLARRNLHALRAYVAGLSAADWRRVGPAPDARRDGGGPPAPGVPRRPRGAAPGPARRPRRGLTRARRDHTRRGGNKPPPAVVPSVDERDRGRHRDRLRRAGARRHRARGRRLLGAMVRPVPDGGP